MPLDLATLVPLWQAEYLSVQSQLAANGGRSSFSDQGRSQSVDLGWLRDRLTELARLLANAGYPVPGTQPPVFIRTHRVRP